MWISLVCTVQCKNGSIRANEETNTETHLLRKADGWTNVIAGTMVSLL